MNKGWVIIRVSNFSKEEMVMPGVYSVKDVADKDSREFELNEPYWKYKFHVVEYMGKEHKNALQSRTAVFQ